MTKNPLYLVLGNNGIRMEFPSAPAAEKASGHIFLSDSFNGRIAGTITYLEDNSVEGLVQIQGKPNAVNVVEDVVGKNTRRTIFRMFDRYTILLEVDKTDVRVRYPSDAPIRLMLDDVLQAALHPILDNMNGFILHGACVAKEKTAVVFMGMSGSGKSTSAFNLTRFGFQSYADDAVLLTIEKDGAWVWPLNREFSIRPLSFRLFHEQGIHIGDYTKDGEKYYFSQTCSAPGAARLEYICFVEIGGESGSVITPLDTGRALKTLLKEKRHFSFMARRRASYYSKLLSKNVPFPAKALVGMDMDAQARTFERMLQRQFSSSGKGETGLKRLTGRSRKTEIIRDAWADPTPTSIETIIPLIGDCDPKVFALALGFFQTFAMAQIEPVFSPSATAVLPGGPDIPWLKPDKWIAGCRRLLNEIRPEVITRFGHAWFKSGPVLYPMLRAAAREIPEKSSEIETAWRRYLQEKGNARPSPELHLAGPPQSFSPPDIKFSQWWDSYLSTYGKPSAIHWWISPEVLFETKGMQNIVKTMGQTAQLVLVPAADQIESGISRTVELAKRLLEQGCTLKIARRTPLCLIGEEDARFIFSNDLFERNGFQTNGETYILNHTRKEAASPIKVSPVQSMSSLKPGIRWTEPLFPRCPVCTVHALGLCKGEYVNQQLSDERA